MRHLQDAEFIDLLEGRLRPDRLRHLDACTQCRTEARSLDAVLAAAREADVPDPSPLFWDHLSARVAEAVTAEPNPAPWTRFLAAGRWRFAAAAIAVILVAGLASLRFPHLRAPDSDLATAEHAPIEAAGGPASEDFVDAWTAIEATTLGLDWQDAQSAGLTAKPGSAYRIVSELTTEERSELARLLQDEMDRTGRRRGIRTEG